MHPFGLTILIYVLVIGMLGVQLQINHESFTKRTQNFVRVRSLSVCFRYCLFSGYLFKISAEIPLGRVWVSWPEYLPLSSSSNKNNRGINCSNRSNCSSQAANQAAIEQQLQQPGSNRPAEQEAIEQQLQQSCSNRAAAIAANQANQAATRQQENSKKTARKQQPDSNRSNQANNSEEAKIKQKCSKKAAKKQQTNSKNILLQKWDGKG